jgi:hypothetical protein
LLQAFYSIRSERQLMERLDFDLLFRWFVGLGIDDPVWDHSTFSKNRDRLLEGNVAAESLATLLDRPRVRRLLSSEHFSVDGSLIQAWASMKSFRPKEGDGTPPTDGGGRNPSRDFRGARRSNASHGSTTDPDALLYRKGPGMEARLCFVGHVLMENRHRLVVDAELTRASGHAERLAALAMLDRLPTAGPATVGADRGFDAKDFVMELRARQVTPHIAQNTSGCRSAIDGRDHPPRGLASGRVSKSRRRSAGLRRSPGRPRPGCAASNGCAGRSPWQRRPTT